MALQQLSFGGVSRISYCNRCKKPLSNPISVEAGMGPICRGHRSNDMGQGEDMRKEEFSDRTDFTKPLSEALVMKRQAGEDGQAGPVVTNVPHLVMHHSPTGFEFGYAGSGPADLALNVCEWYLNHIGYRGQRTQCFDGTCFSLGYALHQEFKREFIAGASRDGAEIPFAKIEAWFQSNITDDLREVYGSIEDLEAESE